LETGEIRFQFGNALLIDLLGTCVHVTSTNPLLCFYCRTCCVEYLNFTPNFIMEIHFILSWGWGTICFHSQARGELGMAGRS
ncbi:MAG: hypothetical protein ACP5VQ_06855, partial [Phycisphaerae bacterium]